MMEAWIPEEADLEKARDRLFDAYRDYVAHVSPAQMAISLETATYVLWAAEKLGSEIWGRPFTAVDFGSGFTSYVLRFAGCDTISVDDSSEWLHWTEVFLNRYGLTEGRLCLLDEFRPVQADLVVYDFGSGQLRDDHFMTALAQIAPGGIGILDDANHPLHQKAMKRAAEKFNYSLYGIGGLTTDWQGRFAALVVR